MPNVLSLGKGTVDASWSFFLYLDSFNLVSLLHINKNYCWIRFLFVIATKSFITGWWCLEGHRQCCWKDPDKVNATCHVYGGKIAQNIFWNTCDIHSLNAPLCTMGLFITCVPAVITRMRCIVRYLCTFFLMLKRPRHGLLQMKGYLCARKQPHHSSRQEPSDDDRQSVECNEIMRKLWMARSLSTWLALFMTFCRHLGKGQPQKGADTAHSIIHGSTRSD